LVHIYIKGIEMQKLKSLLEGYAWERKDGKPLPTLAEVQAEYEAKKELEEAEEAAAADEKPDYIDADNDGNEEESMKDAFADKKEKEDVNESFVSRMKKNLVGGAMRK
jgi:hypothetical protein